MTFTLAHSLIIAII